MTGADFGNIQLVDEKTGELVIAAHRGFPEWWLDYWRRVGTGIGASCGAALDRSERVIVEDVEKSDIFRGTPSLEVQLRAGVRAVQSTPIVGRSGTPLGMISTHWKTPHRPDDRTLRLLDLLAQQAGTIVEALHTQQALRESEERLRSLVTVTSDVLYRMSADWTEMLVLTGSGFLADTKRPNPDWFAQYIPVEDQARVSSAISEAISKKDVFQLEHRVIQADGTVGWTFSHAIPVLDENGEVVEWFGSAGDITERKRREINTALLAEVGKHLADLSDPDEIMNTVGTRIGESLRLSGCQFVDVDDEHGPVPSITPGRPKGCPASFRPLS